MKREFVAIAGTCDAKSARDNIAILQIIFEIDGFDFVNPVAIAKQQGSQISLGEFSKDFDFFINACLFH